MDGMIRNVEMSLGAALYHVCALLSAIDKALVRDEAELDQWPQDESDERSQAVRGLNALEQASWTAAGIERELRWLERRMIEVARFIRNAGPPATELRGEQEARVTQERAP